MTSLKDKLMKDIESGKVAMTPRLYFTARLAALFTVSALILVITVFIVNFIFFSIRINGDETLLRFGPRGLGAFLWFFPWHLAVLDVALVVFLQYLLRRFSFGYRIPVLYLVGALIVGAGLIGFALDRGTPFNDRMHEKRMGLPPGPRGLYDDVARKHRQGGGICRCEILAIEGNVLTVEDTRPVAEGGATSTLTVILPLDSRRATTSDLSVGDIVFIAGEEEDGVINAFGVRKDVGKRGPRF